MMGAKKELSGAELKSLLKGNFNFKSLGGIRQPGLRLEADDLSWWRDAKFGLFIHWGLYSILGRGEWAMFNEGISALEYAKLSDQFAPRDFDVSSWTSLARDAHMSYAVLTTRHHDGFALWDSPSSHGAFDSMHSAARRDFVAEYVASCRETGLRVGLYYSPMDWRFPGYFKPKELLESALEMKAQAHGQVRELTHNYGPIDILWYDGAWLAHSGSDPDGAWLWDPITLHSIARDGNPKTLINPRSGWEGDFYCDEGSHGVSGEIVPVPWEKNLCIGSGNSWGWTADDPPRSFADLTGLLSDVWTRDGNVLLNVGPDKDGRVRAEDQERLREIGVWLGAVGEAVFGTRAGPFQPVDGVFGSTYRGSNIYLHVKDLEAFSRLVLPPISEKISACSFLDGAPIPWHQSDAAVVLNVRDASPRSGQSRLGLQSSFSGAPLIIRMRTDTPVSFTLAGIDLVRR